MVVWILCCQGLFILIQESFGQKVIDSIQGQLRQELVASNFNFLARSITDFTVSGAIECGVLNRKTPFETKIIDLRYMAKECAINRWSLNGAKLEVILKSLNGDEYEFTFISKNPDLFYFALWGFRLLGLIAILGIALAVKAFMHAEIKIAKKMKAMALEVSHDIRSPLSSLSMLLKEHIFNDLEEKKVVFASLERINDIANNLLLIDKKTTKGKAPECSLLVPLVNSVISEKRIQFKELSRLNIEVEANCSPFASVLLDEGLFRRSLSNFLNNAIEAIVDNYNLIISIEEKNEGFILSIQDFGSGIPQDILNKIGQKGFTTKTNLKNSGHGIGVSSSIETIRNIGGEVKIHSILNEGTIIEINLPKSSTPQWLIKEIDRGQYEEIWILDDDPSIHFQWQKKFTAPIVNFYDIEVFKSAFNKTDPKKRLFLVDYELNGEQNGLDIILELEINDFSLLVTSVFDLVEIQTKVTQSRVGMIPKCLIEHITIIEPNNEFFDYVYIDDDPILLLGWEMLAKKKGIRLLTISLTEEFSSNISKICKDRTKIYIDSNLGAGKLKGEDFAKELYGNGYKLLHLATGYPKEEFTEFPWLSIEGKRCPF